MIQIMIPIKHKSKSNTGLACLNKHVPNIKVMLLSSQKSATPILRKKFIGCRLQEYQNMI